MLSIVLPVHNAADYLAERLCELLELLPDLAERFEILVVDDGSTDHTADIAHELATSFPQLRVIRHARRRGASAAIQTGLESTSGEYIIVQDPAARLSPADFRRLWNMRRDEELVVARTLPEPQPVAAGLLSRLANWGKAVERAAAERSLASGTQLIRRAALRDLASAASEPRLIIDRQHGAERIARASPQRRAGIVSHLRDFALGE